MWRSTHLCPSILADEREKVKEEVMLLNDTKWEIRQEMNRQGLKPGAMAASCGVSRQAFWRSTDTVPVIRTFLHIWEELGYDVRIVYEKREEL